jgi:hypothetical protein
VPPTTFAFTGSAQTFTVPLSTNRVQITCVGAAGGRSDVYATGGRGHGVVGAIVTVTPGATLTVQVGGHGSRTIASGGGWPDAGVVPAPGIGNGNMVGDSGALSGGGSSRVWQGSTLLVVGGGGGGVGTGGSNRGSGGHAGFTGTAGTDRYGFNLGGRGGTPSAGGATGAILTSHLIAPAAGSSLHGGNGGVTPPLYSINYAGGGGGGGYYGGGGAASYSTGFTGGGGGGSSWCPWLYSSTTTATNGGIVSLPSDGWVIIEAIAPVWPGGWTLGLKLGGAAGWHTT